MSVTGATTRNDYVASSGQTVFAYTFQALSGSDVTVVVNGVTLTFGSQYTVSNVGVASGGNVTLTVGASSGVDVSVFLSMPIDRTTNYQNAGDFLASDVNGDFDKAYVALNQVQTSIDRSIGLQDDDPTVSLDLPLKAARANKFLSFNGSGQPIVSAGTTSATDFATVNQMQVNDEIRFVGNTGQNALIQKNASTGRDELQIYAAGDANTAGSRGAGMQLYGNSDNEHDGNVAFITGPNDQGEGRMFVSGWDTDTHVTIGNGPTGKTIWEFVDDHEDQALLNLINPTGGPAIFIMEANSTTEGDITVKDGEKLSFGHWNYDTSTFTHRLAMDSSGNLEFYNGTERGSIGLVSNELFIADSTCGLRMSGGGDNNVIPVNGAGAATDNVTDLGSSSNRFKTVFAGTGSINTSDQNQKQSIEQLSDAERRVATACKGLIRKFKFNDAVELKGDEARIHVGVIAQDLDAAFAAEGLDASQYGMFTRDTWTNEVTNEETGEVTSEEVTRLGVRYSELLAFIIAAI
jgi:hypothetical protein